MQEHVYAPVVLQEHYMHHWCNLCVTGKMKEMSAKLILILQIVIWPLDISFHSLSIGFLYQHDGTHDVGVQDLISATSFAGSNINLNENVTLHNYCVKKQL